MVTHTGGYHRQDGPNWPCLNDQQTPSFAFLIHSDTGQASRDLDVRSNLPSALDRGSMFSICLWDKA